MAGLNRLIDSILFHLLAAALAAVVLICLAQVVARYVFAAAFTWAEEISVCLLVWATWGAACLAVRQGIHLRVRLIDDRLGQVRLLKLRLALHGLAVVFLAIVALASRTVIEGMAFMTMMSLPQVPANVLYSSVPAGCLAMIYYLLRTMAEDWRRLRTALAGGS
jgi:TRAP-type C4-dicarboxylate transport system permease small subunit